MKKKLSIASAALLLLLALVRFLFFSPEPVPVISLDQIPDYNGAPYVQINGNIPQFTEDDLTTESFEEYGELDVMNRCTYTMTCIGQDLMPTE